MCEEKQSTAIAVATKVCKCCGRELSLDEFPIHGRAKDGHENVCKACKAKKKRINHINGPFNPKLEEFTPRELMDELHARGYRGKLTLTVTKEINI